MIPRFRPHVGWRDLAAAFWAERDAVTGFESAFARQFGTSDAIAFNYGRGGLLALCKALGLDGAEVVMPAYTCTVVPYAITMSGNTCRFVDSEPGGYNMDLAQLEGAITERTRMVMVTHLFGCPMDLDGVREIVGRAERRAGHKIWVVQDCAHSFGARWKGRLVTAAPDIALFGLGVSKVMTSIFGGMLATSDAGLAAQVRSWRDAHFREPGAMDRRTQQAYLVAVTTAFSRPCYRVVRWLQDETSWLDGFTKAYHMDGQIRLPPDAFARMSATEAAVGLSQLERYPEFEARRRAHARYYREHLRPPSDWTLPEDVDGATYSHFPIRVGDRDRTLRRFLDAGIQLGQLIEYSVPHLAEYGAAPPEAYPQSWVNSRQTINLPVHPDLSAEDLERIVGEANRQVVGSPRSAHAA